MSAAAPATPVERLDGIFLTLREVVAGQGLRAGLGGAIILLLCARLARLAARFARWAGTDPRTGRKPRNPAPRSSGATLPRNFAWLLRILPATATARARLGTLLAEPDMIALLEARPATGRALRPICHLLGIRPPPSLRRPRRTRVRSPKLTHKPARRAPLTPANLPPLDLSSWRPPGRNVAFVVSPDLRLDTS